MDETNEDGSFSHFLYDDPLEFESQGCHKMCRLCACLVQEMKVVNIFTDIQRNLVGKINRFLADKVYPDDGLPPDVCTSCVAKLNYCDRTISSFIIADRKLRDLFEVDDKSNILVEIPVIDKEQENDSQDFETLHLEKCSVDVGIDEEIDNSFSKEQNGQKCSSPTTSFDEDYALPEVKFLPSENSSQGGANASNYLNEHSDSLANQESTVKSEIFVEQICDENLFKENDFEEGSNYSVNMYNGCNTDANGVTLELGNEEECGEYYSEETLLVDEVLEDEVYVGNEVENLIHLQTIQEEISSHDYTPEVYDADGDGEEMSVNNSVKKKFETQFDNIPALCDLCGKTFPDIYRLKCHKVTHSSDRARVCSICGKVFKNYYNMRRHMIIHTEKNFTCATCGRAFYSKTLLAQHMLSHSRERPFKCDICGVAYNRHSNMLQHKKLVHINNSSQGNKMHVYQCNKCGRRLRSELTFKAHLAKHNGGISYFQCETCGKQYKTIELYRVHLRVHTGERPFMCEVCGKSFRGAYTLKQHSWQHRDDCRYSCPYCGRQFKQMYTLIVHKRIHTGEKPYACPICGRCFSQKNDMKKHTRTHDSKGTKRTMSDDALFSA